MDKLLKWKKEKIGYGNEELLNVAAFFNIPIDESRINDYIVKKNTSPLEIIDTKNNILYNSTYIDEVVTPNGLARFNRVISLSPLRKEERFYYIGNEVPIITRVTFVDGEYELVFEREIPNSDCTFVNNEVNMKVIYSQIQNIIYDGIISNGRNIFDTETDSKKGMLQEEFDLIFQKLFMNKSFDEICALVSSNKDYYFSLIREQIEIGSLLNRMLEEGKAKTFKKSNI